MKDIFPLYCNEYKYPPEDTYLKDTLDFRVWELRYRIKILGKEVILVINKIFVS